MSPQAQVQSPVQAQVRYYISSQRKVLKALMTPDEYSQEGWRSVTTRKSKHGFDRQAYYFRTFSTFAEAKAYLLDDIRNRCHHALGQYRDLVAAFRKAEDLEAF